MKIEDNKFYMCTVSGLMNFTKGKVYFSHGGGTLCDDFGTNSIANGNWFKEYESENYLNEKSNDEIKENENVKNTSVDNNNAISPSYYRKLPIECIEVTRHFNYCLGNAIKYLWRAGLKHENGKSIKEKTIEDLKKAIWYIEDEIKQLEKE